MSHSTTIPDHTPAASPESRRVEIAQLLERDGERSIEDLASRFEVSGMTIRRDLHELAEAGRVLRTHGGAAPARRVMFEFRFLEREREHAEQKRQIADVAAGLIQPGSAVLLDSSTTTLAIARKLHGIEPLTVVTTSLPIASELFGQTGIEVILLGGSLRQDSPDLVGALTDNNLAMIRADIAFIGADAIDEGGHVYNGSDELARMLGRMAGAADRVYAVADHSKVGRHELIRFAHLRDWSGLITDDALDPTTADKLQRQGANLLQPQTKTKQPA